MNAKPVLRRAAARWDIEAASDNYVEQAGAAIAVGFLEAVETAFRHIGDRPASGSPRYAHELNIANLRVWPVRRFPYLVFYLERDDHIEVWRVLHAARDIPEWLSDNDGN